MIPAQAIDALFAMFTEAGHDLGDKRLRFDGDEVTIRLKREGETVFATLSPPIIAAKDGGIWNWAGRLGRGAIRKFKLSRSEAVAYVESDVVGTFEERIEVRRG